MNDRFNYTASTLSDDELKERIDNRQKYLPETIEASMAELQNRGVEFSDEELKVINEDLIAQRENASNSSSSSGFNNSYKSTLVEDPDALYFYSKRAIYIFTILFSVVFGTIMLVINLQKIKNTAGTLWTLLFGVVFFALQTFLTQYLSSESHSVPAYLFGLVAASIIDYVLWPRFIGNATFYRARPIWVPLIIGLLLSGLIIWSLLYGGDQ
jgi:hypothetical protein